MPGVLAASASRSTLVGERDRARVHFEDFPRPVRSGACTATRRSKRPGRSSAESSTSGRLVAASTTTASELSKPSSSVRIWSSVCSRSSLAPVTDTEPWRERPIASSSSMKMIAGAASLALANRSRTREAPTPTIASMNSEARDREEGRVRLAGDRAREQRLARARRAREQHAVGHAPAQAPVALGVAQEVDDLRQLGLGLVDAGDVLEGHADLSPGPRAAPASARSCPSAPIAPPAFAARRASRTNRPTISSVGPKPSSSSASSDVALVVDLALIFDALFLQQRRELAAVPEARHLGREQRSSASPSCRSPDSAACS